MKLTLKGSEGAVRGKRKDQASGFASRSDRYWPWHETLKWLEDGGWGKWKEQRSRGNKKNIAQRQRLWHPQHKTAQSRPSESKSSQSFGDRTRFKLGCRWSQAPDKLEWLQRFNVRIRRPSVFVSPNAYNRRIRLSFIKTHLVRFIKVWCVLAPNVSKDVLSAKNKIWVKVKILLRQEYMISLGFSLWPIYQKLLSVRPAHFGQSQCRWVLWRSGSRRDVREEAGRLQVWSVSLSATTEQI